MSGVETTVRAETASHTGSAGKERLWPYALLGLYLGIVFTRSEVVSWFRIQEMFRFQSFHMYGIIGSAVLVGAIGVALIKRLEARSVTGRAMEMDPAGKPGPQHILGGTTFGLGWGLLGACPGPLYVLIGNGVTVMIVALASAPRRSVDVRIVPLPTPSRLNASARSWIMFFRQVFDPSLAQYAYLIGCQRTGEAIVIDPERDIDRYVDIAAEEGLRIVAATETHIHADFLSGVREIGEQLGAKLYLSDEGGEGWRYEWAAGSDYDVHLLKDGDVFQVGNIRIEAVHTPGHTPEHMSFLVTDLGGGASEPIGIASGDFVFVGDLGRPDLLESAAGVTGAREPAARTLYASTERFLGLQDHVQVWPGHGAGSACGKALGAVPQSTVGYERRFNAALGFPDETSFVASILEGQPEPPLYFGRMKKLNRDGVPLLGALPAPARVDAAQVAEAAASDEAVVVDTRADRSAFMAGHVRGSLYAPLGVNFAMVVDSYVDPGTPIVLIARDEDVDEAVRSLVRIGYDRVVGHASPDVLGELDLTTMPTIPMVAFDPDEMDATVLDVRGAAEFEGARVPGAVNIAYTRLADRLDEVPRDRPVAVHCRSGNRASFAVAFLEKEGYQVTFVDGQFAEWPGHRTVEVGAT